MDSNNTFSWKSVRRDFEKHFTSVKDMLYENNPASIKPAEKHFREVVSYNCSSGKRIRGTLVALSFLSFADSALINEKNVSVAHIVGWAVELLHAGFLIMDDIIDNSSTRRGKRCWYLTQKDCGLGLIAVNDGLHMVLAAKQTLYSAFENDKNTTIILKLTKLMDEVMYKTCSGQCLDILTSLYSPESYDNGHSSKHMNINEFSTETYEVITHWKTGLYTFYLPVTCGMILAGVDGSAIIQSTRNLLLLIGHLFQIQDDFLDCYGDVEMTGKVGTDICEGKCTWLIVEALKLASDEQKQILRSNYGKSDAECEKAVRAVYDSLNLRELFTMREMQLRDEITRLIDVYEWNSKSNKPRDLFNELMHVLFQRIS